ncbi:MAG: DUF84 family protein, partial [Gaiellaceae bacterium]
VGDDETKRGATNRAKNALLAAQKDLFECDFAVGIEGGVMRGNVDADPILGSNGSSDEEQQESALFSSTAAVAAPPYSGLEDNTFKSEIWCM